MQVFRSAGVPARSITGVPVFQAEGLSVTAGENEVSYLVSSYPMKVCAGGLFFDCILKCSHSL